MTARRYEPFFCLRTTQPPVSTVVTPSTHNAWTKPGDRKIDRPQTRISTGLCSSTLDLPVWRGLSYNLGFVTPSRGAPGREEASFVRSSDLQPIDGPLDRLDAPCNGTDRRFVLPALRLLRHTEHLGGAVREQADWRPIGSSSTTQTMLGPRIDPHALCTDGSHRQAVRPTHDWKPPSLTCDQRGGASASGGTRPSSHGTPSIDSRAGDSTTSHRNGFHSKVIRGGARPLHTEAPVGSNASASPSLLQSTENARKERGPSEDSSHPDSIDAPLPKKKKKRKVQICTTQGCDKLVVDRGVCIRHGGGKRCNVEGCGCRAQNKGLCWKHGGYTICQVHECTKRAKSRGICWSHGGGTPCTTDGCEKIAVSRGHCWAHGGGKRCKLATCQKPAALRMNDYCAEHFTVAMHLDTNGGDDSTANTTRLESGRRR